MAEIELNIPVPAPRNTLRTPEALTIKKLLSAPIGASILIHSKMEIVRVRQTAHRILGAGNYTVRSEDKGCRVWKTGERP